MRKMFSFMAISADGYHADPDGGLGWQTFGQEFADYSVEQLDEVDTLVLGRTTYTELAAYWTGDLGAQFDRRIADRMNRLAKLVVSDTLETVSWAGSSVALTSVEKLAEVKHTPGKDLAVLGSSTLTAALLRAHLVDEVRLMVNPIILDGGATLFAGAGTVPLELMRVRPFQSGNVLLYYRPRS
ncbi:Dihydrofolate reductase [Nonomuraea solani]|uniref:Dihydrofolate reductase n=1 Tax=Nonomuraea solani TaxID=1144553 RepID=A0A1H6EXS5_9ACTN|nr:dihydrofolate reductase family protein [Nonomuraea solani]SEH01756.1 Dihydrofolate reductase [Nonomuraea solani]